MAKTIQELVSDYRAKHRMTVIDLVKKARVGTRAVLAAESGKLEKNVPSEGHIKRLRLSKTISRLAIACEADPREFVERLGLPPNFLDDRLPEIQVTKDDWEYLRGVMEGLSQPIKLSFLIELLKLRQKPPHEPTE